MKRHVDGRARKRVVVQRRQLRDDVKQRVRAALGNTIEEHTLRVTLHRRRYGQLSQNPLIYENMYMCTVAATCSHTYNVCYTRN